MASTRLFISLSDLLISKPFFISTEILALPSNAPEEICLISAKLDKLSSIGRITPFSTSLGAAPG